MKKLYVVAIACALLVTGQTRPVSVSVDKAHADAIVKEIGNKEEAQKIFDQSKRGFEQAKKDVSKFTDDLNKLKKECPSTDSLNPFGKNFSKSCAQKSAEFVALQGKLAAARAKQVWESELMAKIKKLWPDIKGVITIK